MNAATNKPNEEDLRLTLIDDGSVRVDGLGEGEDAVETAAPAPAPAPNAAPAPAANSGEDDDDDDTPAVRSADEASLTPAELEARRERRRQERKAKRERINQRFADMEAQILARDQLLDQMRAELNQRSAASDQATLANRISQAQENIRYLQEVIADGTKSQNGEAVAKATAALSENQMRLAQLQGLARRMQQREAEPPAQGVDPRMAPLGMRWLQENADWYNPRSNDPLSAATRAIDTQLAGEGFDPRSSAYWDELSRRTEPLRTAARKGKEGQSPAPPEPGYNAAASQGKPRYHVAPGSSGQDGLSVAAGGSGASERSFVLSPERVQALKDAGTWDDPKARADAIRRYRAYDAEQAQRR